MKGLKYFLPLFILTVMMWFAAPSQTARADSEPQIGAASAILIDANSGRILYAHNAHESVSVASTTKILTALLALEHYSDLQQTVTLPSDFANVGESSIWLEPGETHTIEDMLYAMMMRSANDASQALAIAVAGSEAAFAELMNAKMEELGLTESHWMNPHGLDQDEHYSSAYDLAMIAQAATQIPAFNEIIATDKYSIPWEGHADRAVFNHNKLLENYSGADGIKTGYTSTSGNCLVGSATRDGLRLIGVVLNSEDTYGEMGTLLDYGFENYQMTTVATFGSVATKLPIANGRNNTVNLLYGADVKVLLSEDDTYGGEPVFDLPDSLVTPISRNTPVGTASFDDGQGFVTTVELYPAEDMERYTFWGVVAAALQRVMQVLLV